MKRIVFVILIAFTLNSSAQELTKRDSINIAFKAKLLTTNEDGISYSKESILQNIEQQKTTFLKTIYKNFVFIKVECSQKYNLLEGGTMTRFGDCNYYLAFNTEFSRFYKLGGFDTLDIDAFLAKLGASEKMGIFNRLDVGEIEEIDIDCLYNYSELSLRKRRKRGYSCLGSCNETTKTIIRQ